MDKVTRQMRTGAFALLSLILAIAFAAGTVGTTGAQDDDDPCFLTNEELGPCIEDTEHFFDGQCEGIDCYSALEFCCLDEIIVY